MSAPAGLSRLRIDRDAPPPAFAFRVTPGLLLAGVVFAVVMGIVDGFFPARRAAKMPVIQALR